MKLRSELRVDLDEDFLLYKRTHWQEDRENPPCSIRAYFIAKLYQYINGTESFCQAINEPELFRLVTLSEYIITQFYLENHINDRKYRIWEPKRRAKNVEEQLYLKTLIPQFIQREFPIHQCNWIQKKIDQLFYYYRNGIFIDQCGLDFLHFKFKIGPSHYLDPSIVHYINSSFFLNIAIESMGLRNSTSIINESYYRLYIARCFLINGVFFQCFAEILEFLFPSEKNGELITFARIFGMVQQIVNDNFDYIPLSAASATSCKLQEDTFSDARRRLITLPILCYFDLIGGNNSWVLEYYKAAPSHPTQLHDEELQWEMLSELVERKALSRAMSVTARIANLVKKTTTLDSTNPATPFLIDMIEIASSNKFYKFYNSL